MAEPKTSRLRGIRAKSALVAPMAEADKKAFAAACKENPWIGSQAKTIDPVPLREVGDLAYLLHSGNWSAATAFMLDDLAFVSQAADEWLTLTRMPDGSWEGFESMSFNGHSEAEIARTVNALQIATPEERASLQWDLLSANTSLHRNLLQGIQPLPNLSDEDSYLAESTYLNLVNSGSLYQEKIVPLCEEIAKRYEAGEYDVEKAIADFEDIVKPSLRSSEAKPEVLRDIASSMLSHYAGYNQEIPTVLSKLHNAAKQPFWRNSPARIWPAGKNRDALERCLDAKTNGIRVWAYKEQGQSDWTVQLDSVGSGTSAIKGEGERESLIKGIKSLPEALFVAEQKASQRFAEIERAQKPDYKLLGRLRSDCEYFLGATPAYGVEKHLWAHSVEGQIAKMRELHDALAAKPEWLTSEQIDAYETLMLGARAEASAGFDLDAALDKAERSSKDERAGRRDEEPAQASKAVR